MKMVIEEFDRTENGLKREMREETFETVPSAFEAYDKAKNYWEPRGTLLELLSGCFIVFLTDNAWVTVELEK